jgi:hypothetical protein
MTPTTPQRRLSIPAVLVGAFILPWARRGTFAKALALPAAAIVAIQVGWWLAGDRISGAAAWAAWGANGILWILFAVICHRLVLLGPRTADVALVPGWGRRETLFLAWLAAIYVIILAVVVAAITASGTIIMNVGTVANAANAANFSEPLFESIYRPVAAALGTYLFARMSLVLPATAIDVRTTLTKVWWQTQGNGWRLALIVGGLPWVFGYAVSLVSGDEPSTARGVLVTILATALLVVEIAALSLSYRQLAEDDIAG